METITGKNIGVPFKEGIYTHQFANVAAQLDQQHIIYRESILDWDNKLEKERRQLQADKDNMEASGVHSPTRLNIIESGLEGIELQKAALRNRREELRIKIEPLLRCLAEFWLDILNAYKWNHINNIKFSIYIRKYRGLLHEGQSFGLACYSTPEVQKIKKYLTDNYKLI